MNKEAWTNWNMFEQTGDIKYYLRYKELKDD